MSQGARILRAPIVRLAIALLLLTCATLLTRRWRIDTRLLLPDERHVAAVLTLLHLGACAILLASLCAPTRVARWTARLQLAPGDGWWLRLTERLLRATIAAMLMVVVAQPMACDLVHYLLGRYDVLAGWLTLPMGAACAFGVAALAVTDWRSIAPTACALGLLGIGAEMARVDIVWLNRTPAAAPTFVPLLAGGTALLLALAGHRLAAALPASRSAVTASVLVGLLALTALRSHPLSPMLGDLSGGWIKGDSSSRAPTLYFADGRVTRYYSEGLSHAGTFAAERPGYRWNEPGNGTQHLHRGLRLRPWTVGWWVRREGTLRGSTLRRTTFDPAPIERRVREASARSAEASSRLQVTVDDEGVTVRGETTAHFAWRACARVYVGDLPRHTPRVYTVWLYRDYQFAGPEPIAVPSNAAGFDAFVERAVQAWGLNRSRWLRLLADPTTRAGPFGYTELSSLR